MFKQPVTLTNLTRTLFLPALLGGTLLLGACSQEAPEETVTDTAPAAAEPDIVHDPVVRTDYTMTGGGLDNKRYSSLDEINRDNVGDIRAEWVTYVNSGLGPNNSAQGEPVVVDGVIYMVTGQNDVFALDVDTGDILWEYRANLDPANVLVCCGWVQRGLSVAEGKVFVGTLDARVLALDQATGEVVWEVRAEDPAAGYSITGGTRYYDGLVYVGLAGGEYHVRGRMLAYDAETGENVWTFYTVPGPGEIGHDTWPDYNNSWEFGGAPIWQTPAVDPELGMLYFSTGNAAPDLNGSLREGDNLFTVSILALDLKTGEYRWHYQVVRHDIWDYDAPSPVVLFDVNIDGVERKGLSQISKSGYLFFIDRITGEPLTPVVDTPVPQMPEQFTAATQPIPQGDTLINHCIEEAPEGWELVNNGCTYTPFGREPGLYSPLAGSNWYPTSYDPVSGTLYVCASESIGGAFMGDYTEEDIGVQTGGMIYGGNFQLPSGTPRTSYQVAMDVTDHSRKWRIPTLCGTGSTTTAGGLLLAGRGNLLAAYDNSNGDLLAEIQLDAGLYTNPVVFEYNGSQKVLAFAGGSAFGPGRKGDSVWMFSLEGDMPPLELDEPEPAFTMPSIESDEGPAIDLAEGETIYKSTCNACHGENGQGGHAEGGAIPVDSTVEHIFNTAANGVDDKMPAFNSAYNPNQLMNVATYVKETVLAEAE